MSHFGYFYDVFFQDTERNANQSCRSSYECLHSTSSITDISRHLQCILDRRRKGYVSLRVHILPNLSIIPLGILRNESFRPFVDTIWRPNQKLLGQGAGSHTNFLRTGLPLFKSSNNDMVISDTSSLEGVCYTFH